MSTLDVLEIFTPDIEILDAGIQVVEVITEGPQGPSGGVGPRFITLTAQYAVSGHRVVAASFSGVGIYADASTPSLASSVLGITTGATEIGGAMAVQCDGEMVEPSWTWEQNKPIFCGPNGVLTQTAPTSGFSLVVGIATSPTSIVVSVKQPILL
jgi:hypothetical protein